MQGRRRVISLHVMVNFLSVIRPASVLFVLSLLPVQAEHGGLAAFERLTGSWYGISKTPVINEQVEVSLSPDDSGVVF